MRSDPEKRKQGVNIRLEEAQRKYLEQEMILDFKDLRNYENHIKVGNFQMVEFDQMFCLYQLDHDDKSFGIKVKIIVRQSLTCTIEVNGEQVTDVQWLNMSNNKLNCWSQLQNIVSRYGSIFWENDDNNKTIVQRAINILRTINSEDDEIQHKTTLLICQLSMLFSNQKRYCPDSMLFAFMLHRQSSSAYELVRKHFNYPTVRRLSYLSGKLNSMNNRHYFEVAAKNLSSEEKIVSIMIDEIYPDSNIGYRSGTLKGFAENPKGINQIAKTVQAFMMNSMFGSFKVKCYIVKMIKYIIPLIFL